MSATKRDRVRSLSVSVLGGEHAGEVAELRAREYRRAAGFQAPASAVRWSPTDEQSVVLGIRDGESLVSTMRIELIADRELLEKKIECPWEFGEIAFPVMLLSRAATDFAYRGQGLNTVLRYWSLKLAELWEVPYLVGTFVEGSPRENVLKAMGYRFHRNPRGWNQSAYRAERDVVVAVLDVRAHGVRALQYAARLAGIRSEGTLYPWSGPRPQARYVTGV